MTFVECTLGTVNKRTSMVSRFKAFTVIRKIDMETSNYNKA